MATQEEAFQALESETLATHLARIKSCAEFLDYGAKLTDHGAIIVIYVNQPMEDLSDEFHEIVPDHISLPSGALVKVEFFPQPK